MWADLRYYRAFGQTIASEIGLPELEEGKGAGTRPDIHIRFGCVDGPMPPSDEFRLVELRDDHVHLAWNGIGRFQVARGGSIVVDALPDVSEGILGLILTGMAMAAHLQFCGDLVLHGCAVSVENQPAWLFLGDNGTGKSTLAAAFLKAGHKVLTDDIVALSGSPQKVRAAFPSMKLSRQALETLAPLPGKTLPPVPVNAEKLRLRFVDQDRNDRAVGHIFLLKRGTEFAVTPVKGADALTGLLRYSYLLKFGREAAAGPLITTAFQACAALASHISISTLTVPASVEQLPETVDKLIART